MGGNGPPPEPTKILQLRGSWRAKTRTGEPTCSDPLPERAADAAPTWESLREMLGGMGVATKADSGALYRLCHLWEQWIRLAKIVATGTYDDADYQRYLKTGELLGRLEKEFGLTPSSRVRLAASPVKAKADPKDRFFKVG